MSRIRRIFSTLIFAVLSLHLLVPPAYADRSVVCGSQNYRYRFCRVDTENGVYLSREFSKRSCQQGRSWGSDRRGIWVDNGCRAEFVIREQRHSKNKGSNLGTAMGVLGGVAILGAILGSQSGQQSAPPPRISSSPFGGYSNSTQSGSNSSNSHSGYDGYGDFGAPVWAVGKFASYNDRFRQGSTLNVYPSGQVVLLQGQTRTEGFYYDDQIRLDGGTMLNVFQDGSGIKLENRDQRGETIYFRRIS